MQVKAAALIKRTAVTHHSSMADFRKLLSLAGVELSPAKIEGIAYFLQSADYVGDGCDRRHDLCPQTGPELRTHKSFALKCSQLQFGDTGRREEHLDPEIKTKSLLTARPPLLLHPEHVCVCPCSLCSRQSKVTGRVTV